MITIEQLRIALEQEGWKFGPSVKDTGVNWYAYKRLSDAKDCVCNDRPPSLLITPYNFKFDGKVFESAEFSVVGETESNLWIDFKVYSVQIPDVMSKAKLCENMLRAAWNACHGVVE